MTQPPTPSLTITPKHYPDCCLSLSTTLFSQTVSLILGSTTGLESVLVLSIGCGSGLFEAHLQSHLNRQSTSEQQMVVEGVEVLLAQSGVKYLPERATHFVNGTWDICERVRSAHMLVFVYPREVSLVRRYMTELLDSDRLRLVLWFGPKADWAEYKEMFMQVVGENDLFKEPRELVDAGLVGYEMAVLLRRKRDEEGCD